MEIDEKRRVLKKVTEIREYMRRNDFSCNKVDNVRVVIAFAKLRFNEDLDPNIKKADAYNWVENKIKNNQLNYSGLNNSKKQTPSEKRNANIKASKVLEKRHNEIYGIKTPKNKNTVESILESVKDLVLYERVDYDVFLYTPYWRTLRRAILLRDGQKCCYCDSTDKLVVHHLTYLHHYKEHEHLEDLITVCELCHSKIHKNDKNRVREDWEKPTFNAPLPWRADSIEQLQKLLEYRLLSPKFRDIVKILSDEELMCAINDFAETKYREGYEKGVIMERMEQNDA